MLLRGIHSSGGGKMEALKMKPSGEREEKKITTKLLNNSIR